jgi:two-component system, chemotaxis family, protein-glutamate methylesterase/glutaminase
MSIRRIRTLVVDDSALVRKIITTSLAAFPEIEIVGTATDPYDARDKILALNPDVVTLDIDMPKMDGITFLKRIMQFRPMPVIIFSSHTQEGSSRALEALQAGAVDVLGKPSGANSAFSDGSYLAEKIVLAAQTKFQRLEVSNPVAAATPRAPGSGHAGRVHPARQIILMGASTGGTEALKTVLVDLRQDLPGICIVQHIPAYFSTAFAQRLDECCAFEVREAVTGDVVQPGLALLAPGGYHLVLKWQVSRYVVELSEGPKVHYQRPAVDVLFESAARAGAGPTCLALLLTGMGADGADGMLALRNAGAQTIAQDEKTSLVFGMPRAAIERGAARKVLPLHVMAGEIERYGSEAALQRRA